MTMGCGAEVGLAVDEPAGVVENSAWPAVADLLTMGNLRASERATIAGLARPAAQKATDDETARVVVGGLSQHRLFVYGERRPSLSDSGEATIFCCTIGHEDILAASVGIFDDGYEQQSGVAYCAECTVTAKRDGEYVVVRELSATVTDVARDGPVLVPAIRRAVEFRIAYLGTEIERAGRGEEGTSAVTVAIGDLESERSELLALLGPSAGPVGAAS